MTGDNTALAQTDNAFWHNNGMRPETVARKVRQNLGGYEGGDLFAESRQSMALGIEDGKLKVNNFTYQKGFGVRALNGEARSLAHSSLFTHARLNRAFEDVAQVKNITGSGESDLDAAHQFSDQPFYSNANPLEHVAETDLIRFLRDIDNYVRDHESRITQVSANLSISRQMVQIIRADGSRAADVRPMVTLRLSTVLDNTYSGGGRFGGRFDLSNILDDTNWQSVCDQALDEARNLSRATDLQGGQIPVVLKNGWCGVLIHEAVGHALEADLVRTNGSVYGDYFDQQIGSELVNIVDDGALPGHRGSLHVDDEGTPTGRNSLIEQGRIVRFMNDQQSARLMGVPPTGNGRRETYKHHPMTRMTNTYMQGGESNFEEMIRDIDYGVYADSFSGGSVRTPTGEFNFAANLAWVIRDGQIAEPVRRVVFQGHVTDALMGVTRLGNDCALDQGTGMCGKNGQHVPVRVGQPSTRFDKGITVSGQAPSAG
jgi:TldD protein